MGLFDYFRSSYDLGEQFTNVELQTKDIEEGIGGTMTTYWLDKNKVLWCPDYTGTNELMIYEEDHPNYVPERLWMNWEWVKTGKHGRYAPYDFTGYISVYPSDWKGKWEDYPTLRLHFINGVLQDYTDITGNK